jgi:hypothetical protein
VTFGGLAAPVLYPKTTIKQLRENGVIVSDSTAEWIDEKLKAVNVHGRQ